PDTQSKTRKAHTQSQPSTDAHCGRAGRPQWASASRLFSTTQDGARRPSTQTVPTSAQINPMQSLGEGNAIVGLRVCSEPEAKGARMRGRARRRGRGAQGAEQAEGPAIALPSPSDLSAEGVS